MIDAGQNSPRYSQAEYQYCGNNERPEIDRFTPSSKTYAESVALEHIAYLRRSGFSWGEIVGMAIDAREMVGVPLISIVTALEVERAFATAYCACQMRRVAAE